MTRWKEDAGTTATMNIADESTFAMRTWDGIGCADNNIREAGHTLYRHGLPDQTTASIRNDCTRCRVD